MPCLHKFHEYLNISKGYLNSNSKELDFNPVTLIVGTFNPSWPEGNEANWFYGRIKNNYFWDVLPRLYNHPMSLRNNNLNNHSDWKKFCFDKKIVITDLISEITDADENNVEHQEILKTYLDSSIADYFINFSFTSIVEILEKHPSIKNIYFTRKEGIELFDEEWTKVERYVQENTDRNFHIKRLLTPSASARFQIKQYKKDNPQDPSPLRNFIYSSWLEKWHEI